MTQEQAELLANRFKSANPRTQSGYTPHDGRLTVFIVPDRPISTTLQEALVNTFDRHKAEAFQFAGTVFMGDGKKSRLVTNDSSIAESFIPVFEKLK